MGVEEFLARVWAMLIGRWYGPMSFRFICQPLTAVVLAIRVGWREARAGHPPHVLLRAFTDRSHRQELLRSARKDLRHVFIVAFALDVGYELFVYRWVYPLQALLVAVILAVVPYLLVRGPFTRIAGSWIRYKSSIAHHVCQSVAELEAPDMRPKSVSRVGRKRRDGL